MLGIVIGTWMGIRHERTATMHKIGSSGSKAAVCATSKTAKEGVASICFILVCHVACRVVLGLNLIELIVVVQGLLE